MKKLNRAIIWLATKMVLTCIVLAIQPCLAEQAPPRLMKPDHSFFHYLWNGDYSNAAVCIRQNPQIVNTPLWTSEPPLVVAAAQGHADVVELLLTNNADLNARGHFGQTALHYAVRRGHVKAVEVLLKYKADVNAQEDSKLPVIVSPIQNVEIIKLLLAHGADINAHRDGNTVLSQSINDRRIENLEVVQFLLTNGLDVAFSGNEGLVHVVLFFEHTNLVSLLVPYYLKATNPAAKYLLDGALEMAMDYDRHLMASTIVSSLLNLSTNPVNQSIIQEAPDKALAALQTNPALINSRDVFGWTPLHVVALTGKHVELADKLAEFKPEINACDDIGNTALHWAAYFGRADLVEWLVQQKADLDVQGNRVSNSGYIGGDVRPLDFAIQRDFNEIAIMLITNGANLGAHKFFNDTPLHIATTRENVDIMKLLMKHGADVNASSQCSRTKPLTCLDIAAKGNSPEAVQLLVAGGAKLETRQRIDSATNSTLFHLWAEAAGNTNIAKVLLAAGCDVNAKDENRQTPLHVAIKKWTKFKSVQKTPSTNILVELPQFIFDDSGGDASRWLLNHKADVNAKDKNGQTALHLFVTSGNTNAIRYLLDFNADINAEDKDGKTPLARLEAYKVSGNCRDFRYSMIDFSALESFLQTNGATGTILKDPPPPSMF